MPKIEDFAALVPPSLLDKPGRVFYSGRRAFESSSKIYILGLNSGKSPESAKDTIRNNIDKVRYQTEPGNWSRYKEVCDPFHKGVLHLFNNLDLIPEEVPASNLIFLRSRDAEKLKSDKDSYDNLIRGCWHFHREVISRLDIQVIVCLGEDAALGTISRLQADSPPSDKFVEVLKCFPNRGQRMGSYVYRNCGRLTVVRLPHPSRFHYTSCKNDPSPSLQLVKQALEWSAANPS